MSKVLTPASDQRKQELITQIHQNGWSVDYASAENIAQLAIRKLEPDSILISSINYTYTIGFTYLDESYISFRLQDGSFSLLRVAIMTECNYATFAALGVIVPATDLQVLTQQLLDNEIDVRAADNKDKVVNWVFPQLKQVQ